jgi:hypothetical protein
MMKRLLNWCGSAAVLCLAVFLIGATDQMTREALKVEHLLGTIERQSPRAGAGDLSVMVTESELNAYIAYRLAQEKAQINGLDVDLLPNNHVQGNISLDAQDLSLDAILGEYLNFHVKGILVARNGAARLDLISVQLNGRPVKPQVLDFVLDTAARYGGADPGSSDGWYELPKGIKRIAVRQDRAILYY